MLGQAATLAGGSNIDEAIDASALGALIEQNKASWKAKWIETEEMITRGIREAIVRAFEKFSGQLSGPKDSAGRPRALTAQTLGALKSEVERAKLINPFSDRALEDYLNGFEREYLSRVNGSGDDLDLKALSREYKESEDLLERLGEAVSKMTVDINSLNNGRKRRGRLLR